MNVQSTNKRGFTLIEVILVLAIAALIFLMIFVALPALQASQRDTSRKNDASIVSSAVTRFVSSERDAITAADITTLRTYVDDLDQYEKANVVMGVAGTNNPTEEQIMVYPSASCDGSSAVSQTNPRKAAVRIMLDNGNTYYCVDAS